MPVKVGVGGVQRELISIQAGVGGVNRSLSSLQGCIGGVNRNLLSNGESISYTARIEKAELTLYPAATDPYTIPITFVWSEIAVGPAINLTLDGYDVNEWKLSVYGALSTTLTGGSVSLEIWCPQTNSPCSIYLFDSKSHVGEILAGTSGYNAIDVATVPEYKYNELLSISGTGDTSSGTITIAIYVNGMNIGEA